MKDETIGWYRKDFDQYKCWFLLHKKEDSIITFREYIISLTTKYSPATVNRKIAGIRYFYPEYSSVRYLQIPEKKIQVFSIREIILLRELTKEDQRKYLILELFLNTGIREKELINIRLGNINLKESILMVIGKYGQFRFIPLSKKMVSLIKKYIKDYLSEIRTISGDLYLFPNINSTSTIRKMFGRIFRMAGIGGSVHTFRHTFATNLYQATKDPVMVQKILGHHSVETTIKFYVHVELNTPVREAIDNFEYNTGY